MGVAAAISSNEMILLLLLLSVMELSINIVLLGFLMNLVFKIRVVVVAQAVVDIGLTGSHEVLTILMMIICVLMVTD